MENGLNIKRKLKRNNPSYMTVLPYRYQFPPLPCTASVTLSFHFPNLLPAHRTAATLPPASPVPRQTPFSVVLTWPQILPANLLYSFAKLA